MNFLILMAISYAISVTDKVMPVFAGIENNFTQEKIAANIGEAEVNLFQNHFRNIGPNKYNYPTTAFWPRAAKATNWQPVAGGVTISVNQQGVRQRLQGGDIFPTDGKKYLTVPARAEAYGKVASEFSNLQLAYTRTGGSVHAFALVEAAASQLNYGKRNKATGQRDYSATEVGGGVYFWLVKSVHQNPDPTVIPADEDIQSVAYDTAFAMFKRIAGGAI